MRKNWKKIASLVLTAACTLVFTVAPVLAETKSTPEYSVITEDAMQQMLDTSISLTEELVAYSEEELDATKESGNQFAVRAVEAWRENADELGALVSLGEGTYEKDGDFITCTISAKFEKNPCVVRVYWNADTRYATDMTFTVENSVGVLVKQAGMNTIVGIGTVFVVLIFLIFVISRFKMINGIGQKKAVPTSAPAPKKAPAAAPAAVPAASAADDLELQAVITAAIAMYEEEKASASGDAYVARPVNKKRNWKRA